jgi:nitroreductase
MKYSLSELNEVIRNRRSIFPKSFSGRKVHKEQIQVMLENARWAPSHKLTQPWIFKVFMGDGLERFAQDHADMYKKVVGDEFMAVKYEKLRNNALKSSAVIAICMKRDETERIPVEEEISSVAMAVQNLHLTATAYGIGGYWGSGGMTYSEEMHDYLKLGPKDKCLGFFYLGYPSIDWPRKTLRNEVRLFTDWIEE